MLTRKNILAAVVLVSIFGLWAHFAEADEHDELAGEEVTLDHSAKIPGYETALKEKFNLTNDDLDRWHDEGLNNSQITMASQLAKSSGRSMDEIVNMHFEQHMGWARIAKDLGFKPKDIGAAVASLHRQPDDESPKKHVVARKGR